MSRAAERVSKNCLHSSNPFVGVLLGSLTTALVQSSSTVTSVIVGMVAGGLPVSVAIPMVMGANMGTTITNTLVSLGHLNHRQEFTRAFAAATVHDWFNLLTIIIFLPLEIAFGVLERASGLLVLILVAIMYLGDALRTVLVGKAEKLVHLSVGRGPGSSILSGTLVTVLVQSSSTTTSLMVPLAGSGVFSLREVYPFTLGANIGTTITAILAATTVTGENKVTALQIALAHFLYNSMGVVTVYGVPWLRSLPLGGAQWIANLASERKGLALVYILLVFFAVPGVLPIVGVRYF